MEEFKKDKKKEMDKKNSDEVKDAKKTKNQKGLQYNQLFFLFWKEMIGEAKGNWKKFNLFVSIRNFFFSNIKIKLFSLLIGFSIFGYVRMQNIEDRNVDVTLVVNKIDELAFVANPPETINLLISGTRNVLSELDINQIVARLDLVDIEKEGVYTRSPIIEGMPTSVQLIKVNPKEITFELSSLERKLISIEPEFVGTPDSKFELKGFRSSPRKIWVLGPADILQDITKLITEPINIEGANVSKEIDVHLSKNIHPNIQVDLERTIKINLLIASKFYKEQVKGVFPIKIEFPKSEGLISYDYLSVSNVEYQVKIEDSENFDPVQSIVFYVDTSKIKFPGIYDKKVLYRKVKGLSVLNFRPKRVTINVEVENIDEFENSGNTKSSDSSLDAAD